MSAQRISNAFAGVKKAVTPQLEKIEKIPLPAIFVKKTSSEKRKFKTLFEILGSLKHFGRGQRVMRSSWMGFETYYTIIDSRPSQVIAYFIQTFSFSLLFYSFYLFIFFLL